MKARENMKERFLEDVKNHSIEVISDDGVNRHIKFSNNGCSNLWFELVTWKGCLAINGDMGSYMFSRIDDMFNFFRTDDIEVNSGYWGEKCTSEDIHTKIREFDVDKFKDNVKDYVRNHLNLEEDAEVTEEMEDDLELFELLHAQDEWDCVGAMRNYSGKLEFDDFWEMNYMTKSYHFIWCLYAITWGISQYDAKKKDIKENGTCGKMKNCKGLELHA